MDDLIDKAWSCFQRIVTEKKPPDRHSTPKTKITHQNFYKSQINSENFYCEEKNPNHLSTLSANDLPSIDDLEIAFRNFLDELDLSPEKERELNEQSPNKKWMMIIEQNSRMNKAARAGAPSCDEFIQLITKLFNEFPDKYTMPLAIQTLESLSISLRAESFSFVQQFLTLNGACILVDLLNESRRRAADLLAAPILNCFRALLNSSIGRNGVLESENILLAICGAIDFHNPKCKILSLEILSGICLAAEGGHTAVLKALTDARALLGERKRFQKLIDDLHREYDNNLTTKITINNNNNIKNNIKMNFTRDIGRQRETERVRIAIMSLVNALLKCGPTESLEFRLHLRYEFLMLGLQEVIDRLRNEHGSVLEDHFDLFEMMRQEDENELANSIDSGSSSPVNFENPAEIAEALTHKLNNTLALPHFISLLQHMLMIPGDEKHLHIWRLFDLILQQLSLQTAMGDLASAQSDSQFLQTPLNFDMNELIIRLRTQNDYERLQKELTETSIELESERRRVLELENRISDLQDGVSLSAFSRVSDLSSSPSDPCHSPTFFNSNSSTSLNINSTLNNLPPVRPPTTVAPPPPPPSAQQLRSNTFLKISAPKKNVPKAPHLLKTLNWTVIPPNKIEGTLWENIEDEKLYKQFDLQELASTFAAASKSGDEMDGTSTISNTLQRRLRVTESLITVIDPRRAQNCTIMLSKLKLSHREIRFTVLSMDERGKLPKDMIEQMLKFVPTKEEISLLRETVQRHKSPAVLALADRFLYEMSQISRYEPRLKCLYTIRTFNERLDELTPYFNSVISASTTILNNKKLKHFMTLILAIGNYLNNGKRNGNAQGFTISSLNTIQSVKSVFRSDRNLMHFIVELSENKFPELLRLNRELSSVYEAAKYNRVEMESEFRLIEVSLREMAAELLHAEKKLDEKTDFNDSIVLSMNETNDNCKTITNLINTVTVNGSKKLPANQTNDRFIPVVKKFLEEVRNELRQTQMLHREMEKKFLASTKLYAETPAKETEKNSCSPDEFFGTFVKCFNYFTECYQTIWAEREENERAKRQTLVRSIFTKKGNNNNNRIRKNNMNKDFESLVSALQSGELFSEDLSRLRTSIRYYNQSKSKSPIPSSPMETQNDSLVNINGDTLNNITNTSKINVNMSQVKINDNRSKMTTPLRHQITTLVV